MRAFVALTLPDPLRDRLVAIQNGLKRTDARMTWVKREAMHLTVRFLGDIDESQAAVVAAAVREEPRVWQTPLRLAVGGLGAFPNKRNPRVIWVGVNPNLGLTSLAGRMEDAAREAGIEPADKPFSAHLTLGRVKFIRNRDPLLTRLRSVQVETFYYDVRELALIESELTPDGPRYTKLERVELGNGAGKE